LVFVAFRRVVRMAQVRGLSQAVPCMGIVSVCGFVGWCALYLPHIFIVCPGGISLAVTTQRMVFFLLLLCLFVVCEGVGRVWWLPRGWEGSGLAWRLWGPARTLVERCGG